MKQGIATWPVEAAADLSAKRVPDPDVFRYLILITTSHYCNQLLRISLICPDIYFL